MENAAYLGAFKTLDKYDNSDYNQKANIRGSRPFFDTPIYQRNSSGPIASAQHGSKTTHQVTHRHVNALQNQLKKTKTYPEDANILSIFKQWTEQHRKA